MRFGLSLRWVCLLRVFSFGAIIKNWFGVVDHFKLKGQAWWWFYIVFNF